MPQYQVTAHLVMEADSADQAENQVLNALSAMLPDLIDIPDVEAELDQDAD